MTNYDFGGTSGSDDLTGGGQASQAGQGFQQAASGFGGPAPASGLGNQGGLGFQSGADIGHAAQPGPGNPIGQQPGGNSPFQNALNQGANPQGFGPQNQFGGQNQFGAQNQFGPGPSFGPGPDFGNQGLGNQYGNQGFGNQFGNQGFGNQYGYQNQPGDILGNMINNAKAQGLGQLMNSGLLGATIDRSSRRRGRHPVIRFFRVAIWFIGVGIALYFAFHHGAHFENCTGDCGGG